MRKRLTVLLVALVVLPVLGKGASAQAQDFDAACAGAWNINFYDGGLGVPGVHAPVDTRFQMEASLGECQALYADLSPSSPLDPVRVPYASVGALGQVHGHCEAATLQGYTHDGFSFTATWAAGTMTFTGGLNGTFVVVVDPSWWQNECHQGRAHRLLLTGVMHAEQRR